MCKLGDVVNRVERSLLAPIVAVIISIGLGGTLATTQSCAPKNATPQYKAALGVNDFTHALRGFQDIEISMHTTGVIPDDVHHVIETKVRQAFQYDQLAEAAVKAGDFTSGTSYYKAALTVLGEITPSLVGIKNPDSAKVLTTALMTATQIASDWGGVNTTSTGVN